jgi:CTP synthase (UTP-ammonia lyase)
VTTEVRIALVGDFNPAAKAHQGIPRALMLAGNADQRGCEWEWVHTSTLLDDASAQLAARIVGSSQLSGVVSSRRVRLVDLLDSSCDLLPRVPIRIVK